MRFKLSPQEARLVHDAHATQTRAQRDLQIVFTTMMAARGITHATLVALHPEEVEVSVPEHSD